jgi:hypothetical protein
MWLTVNQICYCIEHQFVVENKRQKDQLISSASTEFKLENRRNIETTDEIQIQ